MRRLGIDDMQLDAWSLESPLIDWLSASWASNEYKRLVLARVLIDDNWQPMLSVEGEQNRKFEKLPEAFVPNVKGTSSFEGTLTLGCLKSPPSVIIQPLLKR